MTSFTNLLINEGSDLLQFRFFTLQEPCGVGHVEEVDLEEGLDGGRQPGCRDLTVSPERKFLEIKIKVI